MRALGVIVGIVAVLFAAAWLKLRGPDIAYETLEAKYTDDTSHVVDLPGGFHVHYQEDGAATLPTLLLLHGFGDSYTTWDGWTHELAGRFRIIRPDFPGHGLTRAPDDYELSGQHLVDFVAAFASALQLPPFALVGNSMGGAVAWQFALQHPQELTALILVDAAGFPNETPPPALPLAFRLLQYRLGRALLRHIDNRPLIDAGLKNDVYDKALITPALVDRWAEFQRAPGHRAILMSLNLGSLNQASAAALQAIHVPTLILHGADDPLIDPAAAQKFAAAIPGSALIVYPHVGHLPQIEIPVRSAVDAAAFLQAKR